MGQRGGVHRVQLRLVQVRLDHPFLEVVQHDVAAAAAEVAPGLLVQLGPGLLAGLPHHAPEAAARVPQRGHEQPRAPVDVLARHARERPFAVVDLHLLAGQERQSVELLGLALAQLAHEPFDRVVRPSKAVLVDQVLVNRHGVASQAQLRLDPRTVRLARRGGCGARRRWPPWGNLLG